MSQTAGALLSHCSDALARAGTIYIAFSGGLDSTVLLHAAANSFPPSKLKALHVNHGLSPNADHWQHHCAQVAEKLAIELMTFPVTVSPDSRGIEKAARDARYRVFENVLKPGDWLLMAHHQDDQAETVLYRLLRGAGPAGLAGMPEQRPLGQGTLMRPFLRVTRRRLQSVAAEEGLSWIEDESNDSTVFDRNFLRAKVLPVIAERWPDYRQRLSRASENCRSASAALDQCGRTELAQMKPRAERVGTSIALTQLLTRDRDSQLNILRTWIAEENLVPCGHKILESVLNDLLPASEDAAPVVAWKGGEFRRFRQRLYQLPPHFSDNEQRLADRQILDALNSDTWSTGDDFVFELRPVVGEGGVCVGTSDLVEIGSRVGGERCKPVGRAHSAPLKKLLQEYGLEPWLRDRVPLLFVNGRLAAVAGLFLCEGFQCRDGEPGLLPVWRRISER